MAIVVSPDLMDVSVVKDQEEDSSSFDFSALENKIQCLKSEKRQQQKCLHQLEHILLRHELKLEESGSLHSSLSSDFITELKRKDSKNNVRFISRVHQDDSNISVNEVASDEMANCSEVLQNKIIILERMLLNQQRCINEIERKALHLSECSDIQVPGKDSFFNLLQRDTKVVRLRCFSDTELVHKKCASHARLQKEIKKPIIDGEKRVKPKTQQKIKNNNLQLKQKFYNTSRSSSSSDAADVTRQIYILDKKLDKLSECFIHGKEFKLIAETCFKMNKDIQRTLEMQLNLAASEEEADFYLLQSMQSFHKQCVNLDLSLQEQELMLKHATEHLRELRDKEWGQNLEPYAKLVELERFVLEKEYQLQRTEEEKMDCALQVQALKNSLYMYKSQVDLAACRIEELEEQCQFYADELQKKSRELQEVQKKCYHVNELMSAREEEVTAMQQLWKEFEKSQVIEKLKHMDGEAVEEECRREARLLVDTKKKDSDSVIESALLGGVDIFCENKKELAAPLKVQPTVTVQTEKEEEEKVAMELTSLEDETDITEMPYRKICAKYQLMQELLKTKTSDLSELQKQVDAFYKDATKKDKLIQQLRDEMSCLQSLTNQMEDYHKVMRDKDNKIFQLETDLDRELRHKEEKDVIAQNYQQKIKTQKLELEEKDRQLQNVKQQQEEAEVNVKSLKMFQSNLQMELREKENQCNLQQEELIRIEAHLQDLKDKERIMLLESEETKKHLDFVTKEKDLSHANEETLQSSLFEVTNELKAAEKLVDSWKDKVNRKTSEVRRMLEELERKTHFILHQQNELDRLSQSNDDQEFYIQSLEDRLKDIQVELAEKKAPSSIFSFMPDFKGERDSESPMPEVLRGELKALKKELNNKDLIIDRLEQEIEMKHGHGQFLHTMYITLQHDLRNKEKTILTLGNQIKELEADVKSLGATKLDLEKRINFLLRDVDEKNLKVTALHTALESTQKELDDKRKRVLNLRHQIQTLQIKYQKVAKERDEKKFLESNLVSQVSGLQHKIQNIMTDRCETDSIVNGYQSQINTLRNEVDLSRQANEKKEHKIQVLNCQLGTIKIELEEREKVINNLQSEMNLMRDSEQEKTELIEQQRLQVKRNQSRLENFNSIILHLQSEIDLLKGPFSSPCGEKKRSDHDLADRLKFQIHVLVSEMEMCQYKLQAAQIEWEEKENVYHILEKQMQELRAKLEEKKTSVEHLKKDDGDTQSQEFRTHCLRMEMEIIQEELDSKNAALAEATGDLSCIESQKKNIEEEVNNLLSQMEKLQERYDALMKSPPDFLSSSNIK